MLTKNSRPVIGILTGKLLTGNNRSNPNPMDFISTTSRTSQTPLKKSFDLNGVGLGIVAALEKSGEIPACFNRRSNPIPVPRTSREVSEVSESLEDYTIVTRHRGDKNSYTKVYGGRSSEFRLQNGVVLSNNRKSVFHISENRCTDFGGVPDKDFLSCCYLCRKKLHGEDIYMYRGEKAFCSTECRYRQIGMEERKENKCGIDNVVLSTSPYTTSYNGGGVYANGILAI